MKTLVITGGSGGIGRQIVEDCLLEGMRVINVDSVLLELDHPLYEQLHMDLRDWDDIIRALHPLQPVDYLINNATISNNGDFSELDAQMLQDTLDVNIISHVMLCQWFGYQYEGEHGRIINLTSTRAIMSEANTIPYTISKGALMSLTHSLAITLQPKHITVNAIAPGWIHTTEDDLRTIDHTFHPSNRVGNPRDISRTVLFLLDEESDFINGEVFTIDGGVTKKMIYPE